jgi:hypothetical protein
MNSFKVGVKTAGDRNWAYNSPRFTTRDAAEAYAADLAWRWTAVRDTEIHTSDDEPNR